MPPNFSKCQYIYETLTAQTCIFKLELKNRDVRSLMQLFGKYNISKSLLFWSKLMFSLESICLQ